MTMTSNSPATAAEKRTRERRSVQASDLRLPIFVVATAVVTLVAAAVLSGPNLLTFDLAVVYAIAALGLNVIFGLGGLLSIAQAAIMAVGAHGLMLTLNHQGVGVVPALLLAAFLGAVASGITGVIAMRIRSHYFILASVALAVGVLLVITNEREVTGGSNGLGLAAFPTVFGLSPTDPHDFLILAVPVAGLVWYLASSLRDSRLGIALHAIRSDDYLALSSGMPLHRCRLWATVIGGAFGGLAGGLLALLNGYIGPQDFGLDTAVLLLLMVVFGGASSNGGTVVAALILTALTQGLLSVTTIGELVYGVAIVLLLLFARNGLSGLGVSAYRRVLALRQPRRRKV
jgi:ABC-type branched-subunit amino acid transport system permease subunit